jgi:hypothetical protein
VLVEEWIVPLPTPPSNPTTGDSSPPETDFVRVMRYRPDPAPDDVSAVLLLVPGFLGGAGSLDGVARGVVLAAAAPVEVWALDRRANFLEDLTGMAEAEVAADASRASAYYFGDGSAFAGFREREDVGFVSEWGLETFVADLGAVIAAIPADRRATNLFLGGHSLGGSLTEIYSAWDLAGTPAAASIAGVVLLDGTIGGTGLDRVGYHEGAGLTVPGVDAIRDGTGDRTATLPFIGVDLVASLEIVAMRAYFDPYGTTCDPIVDDFLDLLYGIRPWATNTAILGFLVDDRFTPVPITAMRVGDAAGGSFEDRTFTLGDLDLSYTAPTDASAFYHWLDADSIDPPDLACIRSAARAQFAGPTNFAEWYFPTRLSLDVAAVSDLAVSDAGADYRFDEERLRVTRAADMDAPVLAVAASEGIAPDAAAYDPYRSRIAPTTRGGASRDDPAGFEVVVLPGYHHLDPVSAEAAEPAASIASFLEANRVGTVSVGGI